MIKNPMFSDMEMLENNEIKQVIVDNLLNEQNDWAFVVKSFSYLETIINQYLAKWLEISDKQTIHLKNGDEEVIKSNWKFGKKIQIIKNNSILDEKYIRFLESYKNFRGCLTHDVRTIFFKFNEKFNDEVESRIDDVVSDIVKILPGQDKSIAKNADIYNCILFVIVKIFYRLNYNEEVNPAFGRATMPSLTAEGSAH